MTDSKRHNPHGESQVSGIIETVEHAINHNPWDGQFCSALQRAVLYPAEQREAQFP